MPAFKFPDNYRQRTLSRPYPFKNFDGETMYRGPLWSFANNNKLAAHVASIGFPTRLTCFQKCPGCYAHKLESLRPNITFKAAAAYAVFLQAPEIALAESCVQLDGVSLARWNVTGDITAKILPVVKKIILATPRVQHLIFTKNPFVAAKLDTCLNAAIKYSDGVNYGSTEEVYTWAAESGGYVCPQRKGERHICGGRCKLCWTTDSRKVFFVKH